MVVSPVIVPIPVAVVSPVRVPIPVEKAPPFISDEAEPLDPAPDQDEFHSFSARVEPLSP